MDLDRAQPRLGFGRRESGVISVELVNQGPKELGAVKDAPEKDKEKEKKTAKPKPMKEAFQFPTPSDLTAKDLAPNKPKPKKEPPEKKGRKEGGKRSRGKSLLRQRNPKTQRRRSPSRFLLLTRCRY